MKNIIQLAINNYRNCSLCTGNNYSIEFQCTSRTSCADKNDEEKKVTAAFNCILCRAISMIDAGLCEDHLATNDIF